VGFVELGWVDDVGIQGEALAASDLFLMPSQGESFGMMAVEAMACGAVPVVFGDLATADVVGAPDVGVAPERGVESFCRAVVDLARDQSQLMARSRACAAFAAREYSLSRYVERHLALYESLGQW